MADIVVEKVYSLATDSQDAQVMEGEFPTFITPRELDKDRESESYLRSKNGTKTSIVGKTTATAEDMADVN